MYQNTESLGYRHCVWRYLFPCMNRDFSGYAGGIQGLQHFCTAYNNPHIRIADEDTVIDQELYCEMMKDRGNRTDSYPGNTLYMVHNLLLLHHTMLLLRISVCRSFDKLEFAGWMHMSQMYQVHLTHAVRSAAGSQDSSCFSFSISSGCMPPSSRYFSAPAL